MATHVEAPTSAQTATTAQGRGVAQPTPSHPADDAPVSAVTSSGDPFKRTLTVFDMVVYCLLNICVIWYYWIKQKDHSNPVRLLICPAIGAVVTLVIFISLDTVAHVVGFVWVAIGIAYYLVVTKVLHRGVEME